MTGLGNQSMSHVKFFVVIGSVQQLDFEGRSHDREVPVGEQHVLYEGVLMCGASQNTLKSRHQSKKKAVRLNSFKNVPLCEKCERKFKMNSNLPWRKWEEKAGITDEKVSMEL